MSMLDVPTTARITINAKHYQTSQVNKERIGIRNCDDIGEELFFTHDEFLAMLDRPNVCFEKNYFAAKPIQQMSYSDLRLTDQSEDTQQRVHWRCLWVREALTLIKSGVAKRTERSLQAVLPQLTKTVNALHHRQQVGNKVSRAGTVTQSLISPSASSLRKWVKIYEDSGNLEKSMIPKYILKSKSKRSSYPIEIESIIGQGLNYYQSTQRPTQRKTVEKIKTDIRKLNRQRVQNGLIPYTIPGQTGLKKRIQKLDKYQVACRRFGVKYANDKFALFDGGLDLMYPLERMETDEWKIDLISILAQSGIYPNLSAEDIKALEKGRRWATVVIDCRTRCILGLSISAQPSTKDAMRALHLVGKDKSEIAKAYGCNSHWKHRGSFGALVSDNGSAFISNLFASSVCDLSSTIMYPPAGYPFLRGTIERVFSTFSTDLMSYLSGRTFGNPQERGDYPANRLACLTDHDLTAVIVNYIVDVYHNQPHGGLKGETPNECWARLEEAYGISPPPDALTQVSIFGLQARRKVTGKGVLHLGIDYSSPELNQLFLSGQESKVDIRVDPFNLGWIAVRIKKTWYPARAIQDCFDGVTLKTWQEVMLKLRQKYKNQAELSIGVIEQAIQRIIRINDLAVARAQVEPWETTGKQFEIAYSELFRGMRIRSDDQGIGEGEKVNLLGRMIAPKDIIEAECIPIKENKTPHLEKNLERKKTWGFGLEGNNE